MSWVTVGVVAASSLLSANQAKQKAEQQKNYNLGQAEVTRYSPWTHMQGKLDQSYTPGQLEGAVGGGLQGLGIAQGLKGAFGASGAEMSGASQGHYLDGGQMSADLGNQFNMSNFDKMNNQVSPWSLAAGQKYLK